MVFAVRESPDGAGAGRSDRARRHRSAATKMRARCCLGSSRAGLDARVIDRLVAETRGNPLALLELPRWLTPRS